MNTWPPLSSQTGTELWDQSAIQKEDSDSSGWTLSKARSYTPRRKSEK